MTLSKYSAEIASLWLADRLPELGPGKPHEAFRDALTALTPESSFDNLRDRDAARACISGLWLYHDFLDESHTISQDLADATGSYWHGIMHRREPDASNSKYWFRQVGRHPVLDCITAEAGSVGYSYRSPQEFVDFCERVRGKRSPDEEVAKKVQLLEIQLLFDWCFKQAIGSE